jgi:hypothetical protein
VHFPCNFNDVTHVLAYVDGYIFYVNVIVGHYVYFFLGNVMSCIKLSPLLLDVNFWCLKEIKSFNMKSIEKLTFFSRDFALRRFQRREVSS